MNSHALYIIIYVYIGKGLYELKNLSGQILKKKANVCRLKLFNERSLSRDNKQPPEGDRRDDQQPPKKDDQQPPKKDDPKKEDPQPPERDDPQPPKRDPKSNKCKSKDVFKKVSVVSQSIIFCLLLYLYCTILTLS